MNDEASFSAHGPQRHPASKEIKSGNSKREREREMPAAKTLDSGVARERRGSGGNPTPQTPCKQASKQARERERAKREGSFTLSLALSKERAKRDGIQYVDSKSDKAEAGLSCAADLSAHINI